MHWWKKKKEADVEGISWWKKIKHRTSERNEGVWAPNSCESNHYGILCEPCPSGFTWLSAQGYDFCYKAGGATKEQAKEECESYGLRMVELTTESKAAAFDDIATYDFAWLPLTCSSDAGPLCQTNLDLWFWDYSNTRLTDSEVYKNHILQVDGNESIYGGANGENCMHWWKKKKEADVEGISWWKKIKHRTSERNEGVWAPNSCESNHYGIVCEPHIFLLTPKTITTTSTTTTEIPEPAECVGNCTYCKPHGEIDSNVFNDMPLCADGVYQWACVTGGHGPRVQCPAIAPIMCAYKKCDDNNDYCCEVDCGKAGSEPFGGPRLCETEIIGA